MMRGWDYGYGNMMGGWGWVAWIGMFLFGLLVLLGLVLLVIWAIRAASGGHHLAGMPPHPGGMAGGPPSQGMPVSTHDEAVATVRRRYAAGELTKEQFEEMMRSLGG